MLNKEMRCRRGMNGGNIVKIVLLPFEWFIYLKEILEESERERKKGHVKERGWLTICSGYCPNCLSSQVFAQRCRCLTTRTFFFYLSGTLTGTKLEAAQPELKLTLWDQILVSKAVFLLAASLHWPQIMEDIVKKDSTCICTVIT